MNELMKKGKQHFLQYNYMYNFMHSMWQQQNKQTTTKKCQCDQVDQGVLDQGW